MNGIQVQFETHGIQTALVWIVCGCLIAYASRMTLVSIFAQGKSSHSVPPM
jgi:hypothetical protein